MKDSDVVIIGGGPAGLSAALTLARAHRTVYVFDDGRPRNARAQHMMNFPSRDGTPPGAFRQEMRKDLAKYPHVHFVQESITSIIPTGAEFLINGSLKSKKVLLAHGVKDDITSIPGMQELWGRSMFHCPYCHGYEHLNEAFGIIASGDQADHYATLLKGLTDDLILFTDGSPSSFDFLEKNGVRVYTEKINSIIQAENQLIGVKFETGRVIERSVLFHRPTQTLNSDIGINLGCELTNLGLYKTDSSGMTTRPGVYAAGDIVDPRQSVLFACASGSVTAAAINYAILHERFRQE